MPISVVISRTGKSRIAKIRAPRPGLTRPPFLDRRFEFPVEPLPRCFCWCERRHDAQMRKASTGNAATRRAPHARFQPAAVPLARTLLQSHPWPALPLSARYAYRRWGIGAFLPSLFFASTYYYDDGRGLGIEPPPPGRRWVRNGPDLLLVKLRAARGRRDLRRILLKAKGPDLSGPLILTAQAFSAAQACARQALRPSRGVYPAGNIKRWNRQTLSPSWRL